MKRHWNVGNLKSACGALSPNGLMFAAEPEKVSCKRCRDASSWAAAVVAHRWPAEQAHS